MDHFEDIGPSVVMASPGMMQSGLSRELFESWCTDKRNGVIIAGYCVEGTLAKVCQWWSSIHLNSIRSVAVFILLRWSRPHRLWQSEM